MVLCGHNAKEFDFPYISRRMIIHGIALPPQLDLFGKKPWEVPHIDTMELWKFGDYKSFTPLNLLAYILGIPSPKDDIDGSQVGNVYWQEKNLERIVTYCQKDVVTVMQILLRLKNESLLQTEEVIIP
jgi:DNA polymerase elongation subunit (family B)